MAIEILEVHHTGIRIDNAGAKLGEVETFYLTGRKPAA